MQSALVRGIRSWGNANNINVKKASSLILINFYLKYLNLILTNGVHWLVIRHDRQNRPKQSDLNCNVEVIPILRLI
jgi:hypothetical protein